MRGLSPVAASGGHSSSPCAGLSLSRPLLLRSTGSRRAGSVVVAHGPSCSAACGIFPDQGSKLCPLHWQADSPPLRHQGSPISLIFFRFLRVILNTIPHFFISLHLFMCLNVCCHGNSTSALVHLSLYMSAWGLSSDTQQREQKSGLEVGRLGCEF